MTFFCIITFNQLTFFRIGNRSNFFSEVTTLDFRNDDTRLINKRFNTTPVIIHGSGKSNKNLTSLGNYLAKSWVKDKGCRFGKENQMNIEEREVCFLA